MGRACCMAANIGAPPCSNNAFRYLESHADPHADPAGRGLRARDAQGLVRRAGRAIGPARSASRRRGEGLGGGPDFPDSARAPVQRWGALPTYQPGRNLPASFFNPRCQQAYAKQAFAPVVPGLPAARPARDACNRPEPYCRPCLSGPQVFSHRYARRKPDSIPPVASILQGCSDSGSEPASKPPKRPSAMSQSRSGRLWITFSSVAGKKPLPRRPRSPSLRLRRCRAAPDRCVRRRPA